MAKKRKKSKVVRSPAPQKELGTPKQPKRAGAGSRAAPASKPSPRDGETKKKRIEAKKKIVEPQVQPLPADTPEPQEQQERGAGQYDSEAGDPELVVVAMGSSAGGLEVLTEILSALEPDTGACYVIVQHLSPEHRSAMVELLAPKCSMRVVQARDNMRLEPDRVYVFPPMPTWLCAKASLRWAPAPRARPATRPSTVSFAPSPKTRPFVRWAWF